MEELEVFLKMHILYNTPNNFDKILAAGSHSLIRTTDCGVTWEDIYSDTSIPVESDRKTVSCMDICSTQDNHVWFAHKGAIGWSANYEKRLFKTDNANPSLTDWEDLTANVVINGSQVLRSKYITDILNHPTDPQTVWIALSGFGNGQSSMSASLRVLKTSNGGTSWTDISDGLNLMPVNVLKGYSKDDAFHLLLGNDEGVYQLLEGSSIWERISDNIPANVNVRDIEINYSGSLFRIATFGRGIWEAKIPCQEASGTLDITQNTTWLNDKWLSQNIKVKSGNILTLKGRLRLMSNAKIWVEPGAQLIVNGGSLTSACEDMWYGIILLGNPSLSQSANNQGRAYFLNNAIVSNAEYAVSNLNRIPGDGLYPSGGVIQASNSTFRNNKNDIELSNYRHINIYGTENVNISSFYNCIFETTDSYGQTSTNPHVRLHKVNLNKISGNTFEDKRTDIDVIQDGRIGLYTYKSGYILDQICTGFPPPTDCDGDRNQFLNLKYGVKSYELSNPAQFTVQVKNSTFTDCARGIYLMNIPNSEILKNSIVFEDDIIDYYGLYLDFCTNYHIEENVIGYYQNTGNVLNAANNVVGAIVKNQHSENTSVYRNTFNRLAVGTEAIGQNKHSSFNTGLRIQCNEYNNGQTDIFVKEDPNNSTKGIALNQGIANGETDELAGNLFTDIPSGTIFETRRHIINGTNCATFNYHHHKATGQGGVPRVKPTYTTGSLSVNEETTQYNPNSCPDHIDTGGGIIIGPGKSLANEQLLVVEETKAELAILVDGGNTTELKNDVIFANTQDAYDKYSDLMSKEGYISEEVLEEVAAKETGLNKAMVRDVLVANTHAAKSVKVQAKLEQRLDQLPDYMRAQIQEGLTSLSSKEYLELRKAKAKARHDYLINKSVRGLLKDSVDRTENLLTLLSNTGDLGFEYRKLAILDAKDRTVEAEQVLAHMQTMEASTKENENLQDFVNLRTLLNQWKQEGKNMNALVEADINTLKVYSSKNNKAAARAMGVLAANGQLDYLEPVYLPEEAENRSAFRKWSSEGTPANEQDLLKLYPNPAKNYFTVEYSFTSKDKPIVLKVTDVQGKIVYTKTLQYQQDELLIDAKAFQQGTYYVSIFAGKKVIKTKKLKSNK